MYTYPFEKLEVWQLARKLVVNIYKLTEKFPAEERFGLVNQMRRASVSICSNLAEGSGRKTSKDQAYFYNMAYSSISNIRTDIELISAKINALRKSIL
jgi:four helix bundle protein